jgi:hypothetical protein
MSWHQTSVVPSSLEFSRLRWLFLGVDECFDDGCARRIQRRLNGATDLIRALAVEAIGAACFCKGYEVDGRQCASVFGISHFLLFEFYSAKLLFLRMMIFTGSLLATAVVSSAISMAKPPSPTTATDARSGYASFAAMA